MQSDSRATAAPEILPRTHVAHTRKSRPGYRLYVFVVWAGTGRARTGLWMGKISIVDLCRRHTKKWK